MKTSVAGSYTKINWVSNRESRVSISIHLSLIDQGYQLRGAFLDISNAFNKVSHESLLFKLKQNDLSGNLLSVLTNLFDDLYVLNRQNSILENIE